MTEQKVPWTQVRKKALAQLVSKAYTDEFYNYREQLLDVCADIIAASGGDDLVFVGRSPEILYDFMESLLEDTRAAPSTTLLPFSLRDESSGAINRINRLDAESIDAIEEHFSELNLSPHDIATHEGTFSFVDCVCWGTTFGNLEDTLTLLAKRQSISFVKTKVRYIGITKESLGWTHWRNDEESKGATFFNEGRAKVVTVSAQLWEHLANSSSKTMKSFRPEHWKKGVEFADLGGETASAIRSTLELQMFGWRRDVRRAFAKKLARRNAHGDKWLSVLVGNLLKSTQLRRGNR